MNTQDNNGIRVLELTLAAMGISKGTPYSLLKRDNRVLCALPVNKDTALRTLSLYQPQRWKARAAVAMLRIAVRAGWHTRILEQWSASIGNESGDRADVGVLVGSAGHLCDRAVTVSLSDEGWLVTKIAFGEKGGEILRHEADMLVSLEGKFKGAPQLSEIITCGEVTMLTMPWSEGRSWKGSGTELLPILDRWCDTSERLLLEKFPEWETISSVVDNYPVLGKKLQSLSAKTFYPTIRHGDLTRPNIRVNQSGNLVIHDWERGSLRGIPGMDIVFFLYQDRQFAYGESASESLQKVEDELSSGGYASWMEVQGWNDHVRELMILTFAHTTGCGFFDHHSLLETLETDAL